MTTSAQQLVTAARQQIREIDPLAAAAALDVLKPPVLIDVREPGEFAEAHLVGAINIPRGVLEFQVDAHPALACSTAPALADRQREVLVYCRSGGRSALAALALQSMGFTKVQSIAGGILAWNEAGLSTTSV